MPESADQNLPPQLSEILETLDLFPDRVDRIQALISLAERFEPVPESIASKPYPEAHRVKACESEAYLWVLPQEGDTVQLHFAVENPQGVSAMALAVILQDGLSGLDTETVASVPCDVVYRVFGKELSMGKSMGLMGMINGVTAEARRLGGG